MQSTPSHSLLNYYSIFIQISNMFTVVIMGFVCGGCRYFPFLTSACGFTLITLNFTYRCIS